MPTPLRQPLKSLAMNWRYRNFACIAKLDWLILRQVRLCVLKTGKWPGIRRLPKDDFLGFYAPSKIKFPWVLSSDWFINLQASQEGEFTWNCAITSTSDTSHTIATHFSPGLVSAGDYKAREHKSLFPFQMVSPFGDRDTP